ncbi:MAG: sugar transferase [Clostridiaceae bacterium BRH_c20a]|nr:MAG: sugar transferase [Clostridiaceae bacterium BRH_c20a]
MKKTKLKIYESYFKKLMDFILALMALVILSPLMLLIGVLVRIKLGSPVIFKQERPGLNENKFTLYKFRTMTDEKGGDGQLLTDDIRLTKFGVFLRATSLDELPELVNIIKGDMSIIGPRPLLDKYVPLYSDYQRRRHEVRPGLSGLAQISGRNVISWDERFKLDVDYVDNITFLGDCKIILLTLKKVFIREGISSNTSMTMEPFLGNKKMED